MCTICNVYVRTGGGDRPYWLRPLLAISPNSIFPDYHTWKLISKDRHSFYNHHRQLQSSTLCRWQEWSSIHSTFLCRDSQIVRRESGGGQFEIFNILTVVYHGVGIWRALNRLPTFSKNVVTAPFKENFLRETQTLNATTMPRIKN
jgi:hypothetical protein